MTFTLRYATFCSCTGWLGKVVTTSHNDTSHPIMHDNLLVGTVLSSSPLSITLAKIMLSTASVELRCFYSLALYILFSLLFYYVFRSHSYTTGVPLSYVSVSHLPPYNNILKQFSLIVYLFHKKFGSQIILVPLDPLHCFYFYSSG